MSERQAAMLKHAVELLERDGEHDFSFEEIDRLKRTVGWMVLPLRGRQAVAAPPSAERDVRP